MTSKQRKPAAFRIAGEANAPTASKATTTQRGGTARAPKSVTDGITMTEPKDDPFLPADPQAAENIALADELTPPVAQAQRRRFSFGKLALTAFGLLFSLAFARDAVRRAALAAEPVKFSIGDAPLHPEWSSFALFLVAFLAGLGVIAWLWGRCTLEI